jgi:hypothetical protein
MTYVPEAETDPIPLSIEMSVALLTLHRRVVDWPNCRFVESAANWVMFGAELLTVTVVVAVTTPAELLAVSVYRVVEPGEMLRVPLLRARAKISSHLAGALLHITFG